MKKLLIGFTALSAMMVFKAVGAQQTETKVTICHKGNSLCISPDAVPAHLGHGDKLGNCASNKADQVEFGTGPGDAELNTGLSCFPNPFSKSTTIRFQAEEGEFVFISILDISGKVTETIFDGSFPGSHPEEVNWDASEALPGIYLCLMTSGGRCYYQKLVLIQN